MLPVHEFGVSLSLPLEPLKKQRSEAGEQTSDTARGKDSRQTHLAEGKKFTAKIRLLVLTMLLMLLTAIAMLFQHAPVQNKHKSTFRMLGDKDGYIFFKMASDKVTFKEVVSAYNTLTLPLCRQNGHYLYYLREPNMNLFLQCLNPVETAVPNALPSKSVTNYPVWSALRMYGAGNAGVSGSQTRYGRSE
ncbi:Uncharacterised protein [Klebsiella pneumoniae]|nr:Uncharacterised protein [Klebsiella pneumoniae]